MTFSPAAPPPEDFSSFRSPWKSWLAVVSVSLGSFVLVTSEFLPIGLLTRISSSLQISDGTAGLMVTIPGLVGAVAAPVMTVAAGHIDRRKLVLVFLALLVFSNWLSAVAPNFEVMLAARVMFGVSLGGFWTIAVTLGNRLVPKTHMAQATTIILGGVSLATVLGVPAGTIIAGYAGWRAAFAVVGGVALLTGVTQWFVLPSLPAPPAAGVGQLVDSVRHIDVRLGLATVACVICGHFAAYTYVTPFLKDAGASLGFVSTVLLAYGAAGVVGNFVAGATAVRFLRGTIISVILGMAGSIFLLPVFRDHLTGVVLLIIAWGLAFGGMPIALNLWVFKAAPEALEGGAALLISTFQIFIALGSVLGGRIVDTLGTSAVMWAAGSSILVGLVFVGLSRHGHAGDVPTAAPAPMLKCSCSCD